MKTILLSFLIFLVSTTTVSAQIIGQQLDPNKEEILNAKILNIVEEKETKFEGRKYINQKLKVRITSGVVKGREIVVQTSNIPTFTSSKYKTGETLILGYINEGIDNEYFYIIGRSRTTPLAILCVLFLVVAVFVARKKGVTSLLGMGASFVILFVFILPLISQGKNPVVTSIIGTVLMTPIIFYLSHGVSKKTTIAMIATIITLTIVSILAKLFIEASHLTGLVYEEVETLLYIKEGNINLRGLLIAGTVIGALGILDDITVSQTSIVYELKKASPKISMGELYKGAMMVGRDHIASVINTLILVYVGASLSTLLLFAEYPRPFIVLLNNEIVAIQIVVSLVGTIGLIAAVPITTFLACAVLNKKVKLSKIK